MSDELGRLQISEQDFRREEIARIHAISSGETIYGDEHLDVITECIPRIVARKLARMVPDEFEISEVSMQFGLGGKIFSVEVSGNVSIKFTPKREKSPS